MTPERWQRVKEILEQAWERDAAQRSAFVNQACADDPELRSRVEALLTSDQNAGEFLATPVLNLAAASEAADTSEYSPGRRIGPYQILQELGHGGMGTVYLAERADGQYRKRVAIKLVSPHLGTEEILQRFRNERQVVADLDHPNIARLLDGGATEDGLPYLAMEFVEGVRIDTWCDSRKLPVRDRVRLFRQVCAAVQYAHEHQVIHRDIKPGNILVTADGTPKLLDFGIAKVLNRDLSNTAEATKGLGPMTPEYASPEQVRGEGVGPASDVYALGVLLYRLLTGQFPYSVQGADLREIYEQEPVKPSVAILDAQETVSEVRSESPAGLRRLLARDLDNIVLKALRRDPERRYSSVAQFSEDLGSFLQDLPVQARKESLIYRGRKFLKRNRVATWAAAVTAVSVLALVAALGRLTTPTAGTESGIQSIAVLPLENLSGDREQEYFADGITDALIGDLASIHALRVISRTSVMPYKGAQLKAVQRLPEIARKLGVQTIAEGSVLRAGGRVRISVRLIDGPTERPVWSGSYEGELSDVLALQSEVAQAIAGEIHVTLTAPDKARGFRHRRVDLGAYDAYLKGRHQYLTEFTKESQEKAIVWFHRALQLDPSYAPAYAALAECYFGLSNIYSPPTEVMPKAKWAAQKAIELDDTLGEGHASLALVRSLFDFDRPGAEKEFKRALELKPSDADAHLVYGQHLAGMGRFDEAVAEVERAQKLDPVSPAVNAYIGLPLFLAHRYDQAIQRLQPIAEIYPNYHHPHVFLGLAYEQKGEWTKAIAEMERAYELDKEPEALAQLGHAYAVSGRIKDARKVLSQLRELSRQRYVSAYNIALLYAGLGERDEAFRWLQKVDLDRSEWFAAVNVDPRLDALHSDPRFAGVLWSVGLGR